MSQAEKQLEAKECAEEYDAGIIRHSPTKTLSGHWAKEVAQKCRYLR